MSELVGILGVQHNPLLWRTLNEPTDPALIALRERFDSARDSVMAADPDVIVMIGTDHLTQWFYENMPSFLIGKAPRIPTTFENERREFGIEEFELTGDVSLATWLLSDGLRRGVDFASSDEFRADHSIVVPLRYLTPTMDVPIVPVFTNCIAPPLPTPQRFYEVGRVIREAILSCPLPRRVFVIASGHLATEVGGPRHFSGPPDPAFDEQAVRIMAEGAVDEALRLATFDRLLAAGNVTHQFLNFVLALGVADGAPASRADAYKSRFATCPFFEWGGN